MIYKLLLAYSDLPSFFQDCPYCPHSGKGYGHWEAYGQHFAEHRQKAALLTESCEKWKSPGELAVDYVIYNEHEGASPQHFFKVGNMPV